MKKKKFFLMIVNLNEEGSIKYVLEKIPSNLIDGSFIIDGGSTDKSVEIAKSMGFKVMQQEGKGKGSAFRTAIKYIDKSYDYVIILSTDGNERAADIAKIIDKLNEGYDMVIATRFGKGRSMDVTPIRLIGNHLLTFLCNLASGYWITDAQNSFRGIKRSAFAEMNVEAKRFDIEAEMLIKAGKMELKLIEIPTIEDKRPSGKAHLQTFKDGYIIFKRIIKEAFRNPPYIKEF